MHDDDATPSEPERPSPSDNGDECRITLHIHGAQLRIDHPPGMALDVARALLLRAADFFEQQLLAARVIAALDQRAAQQESLRRLGIRA